jgi:transcriptional activator SPT7
LHAFFAQRIESGLGLADDPTFDPTHAQISSNGHITAKFNVAQPKKKVAPRPKAPKKAGVGKGNWGESSTDPADV